MSVFNLTGFIEAESLKNTKLVQISHAMNSVFHRISGLLWVPGLLWAEPLAGQALLSAAVAWPLAAAEGLA